MSLRHASVAVSMSLRLLLAAQEGATADVPFDKEHFADAAGLKAAQAALKKGNGYFTNGGSDFTHALEEYGIAHAFNPNNADLNLRMGLCHLNGRFHHRALPYFQAAYELDHNIPRIHFLLGAAYQLNAEWDKAIAEYEAHKQTLMRMPDPEPLYNSAERRIAECRNGKSMQANPVNAQVSNLGPVVNSEVADYGVLMGPDGNTILFTSRRSNSTGGKINKTTNEYFEDVYQCDRTEAGWSPPVPLPAPANSEVNDASVGLFNGGNSMLLYRDVKNTGDLFVTTRTDGQWSTPVSLGEPINSASNETSAWFSADRKQLYFVSDREGGLGGLDIWISRWDEQNQTWGEPENPGPVVNTFMDEDGVFLHPDGQTLYFSSKGHAGMGGYDVFKSRLVDGRWSKPENLGWPVNSPDDDLFFVLSPNGRTGHFSSVRPNGYGEDDLYRVDFAPQPRMEETASAAGSGSAGTAANALVLKGQVKDDRLQSGMEASIAFVDLQEGQLVHTSTCDARGNYLAVLPSGRDYAMHVRANGYLLHSEHIHASQDPGPTRIDLNVALRTMDPGVQEALPNIFFERDQAQLDPRSLPELAAMLDLLREHPSLKVEIGGHTDADGPEDLNDELSTRRANAVLDHLVNNGIPPERLVAKGYGASDPMVPNDNEANKARNRRVGIRVL